MAAQKRAGGRPRTGTLEFRGKSWWARLTVTIEGESLRKWFDLETDNKAVAKRKVARILKDHGQGAVDAAQLAHEAKREETFPEAAVRIVGKQRTDGLKTADERLSRLRRYAFDDLALPVSRIRPLHIRTVLEAAGERGLAKQSVVHLRNDLNSIFGDLWRDEAIGDNPVARVKLPKGLKRDRRPRIMLTDEHFGAFMAAPGVPEHLHLMALTSRCFGGQRTSDLHAWDWSHVDTLSLAASQEDPNWKGLVTARIFRPKTDADEAEAELVEQVIPDVLCAPLHSWWTRQLRPIKGPVFPVQSGERVGDRQGKRSHARELRRALWNAGIHAPLEGFEQAMGELRAAESQLLGFRPGSGREAYRAALQRAARARAAAMKLDVLQSGSERFRAVDFHSFRRAFNTALGAAGVNVQQAMALAGHKDPRTHMRYVQLGQRGPLPTPLAALPVLPLLGTKLTETLRPHGDLNPGYRRERPMS